MDSDQTCFDKARAAGEPTFTLRAQDLLADLAVDFWVSANVELRAYMEDGVSIPEAKQRIRAKHHVSMYPSGHPDLTEKDNGAVRISMEMAAWPSRKVAD